MYTFLKSVVKNIIPKEMLIRNENRFRKLLKPFYQGKDHECNIVRLCLKSLSGWKTDS